MLAHRKKLFQLVFLIPLILTLLSACTSTKLTRVWSAPANKTSYKKLFIIGVASSQQNRRLYENHFVAALGKIGVQAIESYKLIKSDVEINRQSVTKAIKGLAIDGVLITHLVAIDEKTVYQPAMDYKPVYSSGGYSAELYSYYPKIKNSVHSPGYSTTHEIVELETNLYDVNSEKLVWSASSRSFASDSVDKIIVDLTRLVIADLEKKHLISRKY